MRKSFSSALTVALVAIVLPTQAFAGLCCVSGTTPCVDSPVSTSDTPFASGVCGKTVTTAGCEVIISSSVSYSGSGDCLTLGRGVKVTGNNRTIDCTSGSCGTAINVTQSGSGTTIVNNLNITGPWTQALYNSFNTTGSQANYVDIDLEGNTNAVAGIDGFKTIDRCTATGIPNGAGYVLRGSATVTGSSTLGNRNGVHILGWDNVLDNTLLAHNTNQLFNTGGANYGIDLQGVTMYDAINCDCGHGTGVGTCYFAWSTCSSVSGTRVSFINDAAIE
jgi:hypothetical protein